MVPSSLGDAASRPEEDSSVLVTTPEMERELDKYSNY